ncbi:hypothetical protein HYU22_02630 [Candidatus Woesearchaeota archaeon]|nr:hypothetical protein [Candidatus Woesearchaeota archaeon]
MATISTDLADVKKYTKEVHQVYAGIAKRIEELIELLNRADATQDKVIKQLADRILRFLQEIKSFVKKEKKIARSKQWSESKKSSFVALIQKELQDINLLMKELKIERKHPNHQLVRSMYALNKEIRTIMAAEEAELEAA